MRVYVCVFAYNTRVCVCMCVCASVYICAFNRFLYVSIFYRLRSRTVIGTTQISFLFLQYKKKTKQKLRDTYSFHRLWNKPIILINTKYSVDFISILDKIMNSFLVLYRNISHWFVNCMKTILFGQWFNKTCAHASQTVAESQLNLYIKALCLYYISVSFSLFGSRKNMLTPFEYVLCCALQLYVYSGRCMYALNVSVCVNCMLATYIQQTYICITYIFDIPSRTYHTHSRISWDFTALSAFHQFSSFEHTRTGAHTHTFTQFTHQTAPLLHALYAVFVCVFCTPFM